MINGLVNDGKGTYCIIVHVVELLLNIPNVSLLSFSPLFLFLETVIYVAELFVVFFLSCWLYLSNMFTCSSLIHDYINRFSAFTHHAK